VAETLRIGELAAEFGLNPKTIRYYESMALLPRPKRTRSGYRKYARADRDRLEFVLKARAIGLTLEDIGEILRLREQE
jgi:MerR family Zn(II)-responsive transcriptional regulator of zntA